MYSALQTVNNLLPGFGLLLDLLVCLKSLDIEADLPCDRAKWRKWIHIAHPN
jgi:hypothetical protein